MKKTIMSVIIAASLVISVAACGNKENKTETKEKAPSSGNAPASSANSSEKKTEISVGPDGAEIKTKTGTAVKVNEKGASATTKDVKIKIGTKKDTTKN